MGLSERKKLEKEVRKQFTLGVSTLRPRDHVMFEQGLREVLKKDTKAQKYWIRKCEASRAYTETTEANMLVGIRNIFRRWAIQPD